MSMSPPLVELVMRRVSASDTGVSASAPGNRSVGFVRSGQRRAPTGRVGSSHPLVRGWRPCIVRTVQCVHAAHGGRPAANAAGFPVFEVPYAVPFIAITEVVFTRLVAEQYDLLSRSLEAEHTLTKAVLDGQGTRGIVTALSRATSGWAVLFDLHGSVVAA